MKTDSEKFIEEYEALCAKYNLEIEQVASDMYALTARDAYCSVKPMTKEDWENIIRIREENEIKRKTEEDAKRKAAFEESKKRYLESGGELDENGNIPIPSDYCSIIPWSN